MRISMCTNLSVSNFREDGYWPHMGFWLRMKEIIHFSISFLECHNCLHSCFFTEQLPSSFPSSLLYRVVFFLHISQVAKKVKMQLIIALLFLQALLRLDGLKTERCVPSLCRPKPQRFTLGKWLNDKSHEPLLLSV